MRQPEPLTWLATDDQVPPVAAITGRTRARIETWTCERIAGGAGETLGVWRITGEATVDGALMPFMVILKGWPPVEGGSDIAAWNWPGRERAAYAAGMLDALPGGIRAPRCHGDFTRPDGSTWAWLGPVSDGALERWELKYFATVARTLGRFNGAYLNGEPLPDAPWLSRRWTRSWTEDVAKGIASLPAARRHPLIARVYPEEVVADYKRIWTERQDWYATLAVLPRTFAHLDAFRRNIFLREVPDGEPEIGLIDWGFAGIAAVGEEIGPLVMASLIFGEAPGIAPATLDTAVFAAYLDGLREAGWTGDAVLVRAGHLGSLVLRYGVGVLRLTLPLLADEQAHPMLEQVFGAPIEALAERNRALKLWLVGLAEEFRVLRRSLQPSLPDAA